MAAESTTTGELSFVIITGLSGAGKSKAADVFEDRGYFCVDNLPPALIPKFAELCRQSHGEVSKVALVVDIRGREFFDDVAKSLVELEQQDVPYQILFLEASDSELVKRYKESRRRHPLANGERLLDAIGSERHLLERLRGRASLVIDTTGLKPADLQRQLEELFADDRQWRMVVNLVSFGFKYGMPIDADLVFDVRFLPNPHYVPSLKSLTGKEAAVAKYVMDWPVTQKFVAHLDSMLEFLLPQYVNEGKSQLTIGIGCTGGRHRSVAIAGHLASWMTDQPYKVVVEHRDVDRNEAYYRQQSRAVDGASRETQ